MKYTEADTPKIAAALLEIFLKHTNKNESLVVALHGNLGAGKTTLTKHLASILRVEEQIQSPTFVIQKNYTLQDQPFESLVHIDAYRIEEEKEMEPLNLKDTLSQKKSLIIIEWPEQISGYIPKDAVEVFLDYEDQDSRSVRVEVGGEEVTLKS
jgi:tRNA threonylcarbamoyladenosine biosynthesis protein TsaE